MKTIYFRIFLLLFPLALQAQTMPSDIFLFEEFTDGEILLTNKKVIETKFNYDCNQQVLYFMNGKEYMQMYNTTNVDTLRISGRLFVPTREEAHFYECIPAGNDTLFVDWKIKSYYKGKAGAMGTVTQAGGQATYDMSLMQNKGASVPDNSVYKKKVQTSYMIRVDGKSATFNNLKTLLKLFPDNKRKAIREIEKEESTDFDNPWQVAKLLTRCGGVSASSK